MVQDESRYLGEERIPKLLAKFSIPCILSLIISCFYNIVDQIFVGNGIGYLGNAATGIIFPITVIGWGASLFFGDGAAAYLSVALGKRDTEKIHRSVGNAVLFAFLSGVAIAAIGYIGGDALLTALGATGETLQLARDYGYIIYAMMPLALAQNCLASIIRADGSPRYAMVAMVVGAVINIIGDPVAIFVLHMGIRGAAWATILGQFVSFAICLAYLRRSRNFHVSPASLKPDFSVLRRVMALGTSSFLTQLSIVVITVVNNVLLVKYGAQSRYGAEIPLSAFVVIMKLFQIVLNIAIGIAAGAQPIVGYNYGAQKYGRVRELLTCIIRWTVIVCAVATLLFELVPGLFIAMFGSSDNALYADFAVRCLRIYLSGIILTCTQKVCAIFLQSIGNAKAAAPLSLLRDLFLIVLSLLAPGLLGVTGIFWAAPVADVLAIAITAAVMVRVWRQLGQVPVRSNRAERAPAAPALAPSHPGVIVTIAREHGSSGKRIAQLVAGELGVKCYYKEMTALAAQESGLAQEFISDINVNAPSALHELYLSTAPVQQAIAAQSKIIHRIADAGSCVIVGRSADYVLREREDVARIFIHAPEAYRVRRVMEIYGDSEAEAARNIRRSDDARAAYYRNVSGAEWGASGNYELSIDSSIGVEQTAKVILAYLREREERARPDGQRAAH